jgi:NAD dependent epimerase/dehydratase
MKKKKILITGAAGFIGSHLTEYLSKKKYKIIAFDRYNSDNNWGWLENSLKKKNIEFVLGDIRDYDSVYNVVKKSDVVIHLAALIGIPYSYISPSAYLKTNIEGTLNILEASRRLNIKQVISTSTSEVYGTAKKSNLKESDSLNAQSPYAASKIAADQLALCYFRSFGLPVKIVRPFNTFGPRQSARAVIPTIVTQAITNKKIKIGNLNAIRDFLYVEDLCEAYEKILTSKKLYGEIINVGSNKEISVKKLIIRVSKILNSKVKVIVDKKRIRPKYSEVERLKCNTSKLRKNIKWKPKHNLEKGLKKLISWLREKDNLKNYKPNQYNI